MLVAVTSAPVTTWTEAVAGPAVWVTPVLVSCQAAEPPRASVCAVAGAVQPDQVRLRLPPIPLTGVAGGVVQVVPVSVTPVTFAAAVPDLVNVSVMVNDWPVLRVGGVVVRLLATTAAGV